MTKPEPTKMPGMDRHSEEHKKAFREMANKTTATPYFKKVVIDSEEKKKKEEEKVDNEKI